MSFLTITDPKKRDSLVEEFLKTKRNIQQNNLSSRIGDIDTKRDLSKYFRPVTDAQKDLENNVVQELTSVKDRLQELPKAISFPQNPSIAAPEEIETDFIGPIAKRYLSRFVGKEDVDKTFGLYNKHGNFYIGDKMVQIVDDNLIIDDEEYEGTPGFWELIISKHPSNDIYTEGDYHNYSEILIKTNAIRTNNDPKETRPKASKASKWKDIVKPIWDSRVQYEGSGVKTVVIPSDPSTLVERLDLLIASKAAGNSGVRNESVSICDELLRQKVFDKKLYKNLITHI